MVVLATNSAALGLALRTCVVSTPWGLDQYSTYVIPLEIAKASVFISSCEQGRPAGHLDMSCAMRYATLPIAKALNSAPPLSSFSSCEVGIDGISTMPWTWAQSNWVAFKCPVATPESLIGEDL